VNDSGVCRMPSRHASTNGPDSAIQGSSQAGALIEAVLAVVLTDESERRPPSTKSFRLSDTN